MARFLMCPPDYYGVQYEINPWMDVRRNAIRKLALAQWDALRETLASLPGVTVDIIEPQPGLPDMVFTANAGIVAGRRFIPSRFRPPQRRDETPHHERWFAERGYAVETLPEGVFFEGEGDALRAGDTWFVGYYFRSDARAHEYLSELLSQETLPLRLIDPKYYHLDTCFQPLDAESAIVYPDAFDDYSKRVVYDRFRTVIEVSPEEASRFCCNSIVVGRSVIMPLGCPDLLRELEERGYDIRALDFSEFIKAGGAGKCMVLGV